MGMKHPHETILVLHNIRSMYNVGSIFRTADAAGVSKIYLTGYTPAPRDRFGRARKEIQKTALGAETAVAWERVPRIQSVFATLKAKKFFIVGIEQSPRAIDYGSVKTKTRAAFIFGNEVRGLSPHILKQCDIVAEIEMRGKKESLNVSVAAGIILFGVLR